ncbi:MAG: DUF859 family phage minor structural protein [Clostridia bacterium]
MASIYGEYSKRSRLRLDYSYTQSIENNTTTFTLALYAEKPSGTGTHTYGYGDSTYTITGKSGSQLINGNGNWTWGNTTEFKIAESTYTYKHNDDGTGSCKLSASWYTGLSSSSVVGNNMSVSDTVNLPTIPRASSVSGGTGNIGSTATISISRASSSFTHTLRYAFGSLSGTIATGVATSYTWTIPTTFYAQIPNAKSGTGTIYCDTYSGSTLVGTKSVQFTATASESTCRPTVTATLKDTNSTTTSLTGNSSKLVKYKSTAQLIITSTVKNSATIKSVTVNGTSVGTSSSITVNYSNVSTASFTIVTTDSRGYTNTSYVVTPSYVDYVPLTLNATFFRPQPTTGEVQLTYSGKYYNGSFGAVSNTLSITWKYKKQSDSSWTTGGTITPTLSGNTISSKTVSLGTSFDYQTSYDFQITAVDKLVTTTTTANVSVGMPVFYWGKDFFNFTTNTNLQKSTGDVGYYAKRTDTGTEVWMGVGSGGVNHGVYSKKLNKWLLYADTSNVYINGLMFDLSTNNTSDTWVPVLNAGKLQHRVINANINNALPVSLFDNSSGTTGNVTLSESAANFSYLEIFYYRSGNDYGSTKIYSPNGKMVNLISNFIAEAGNINQIGNKRVSISGTNISVTYEFYINLSSSGNNISQQSTIYIYKVIGYR